MSDNTVENREDASDDGVQGIVEDQHVEDIEEELKTTGSFNMKKFREKLKSGDFITGMPFVWFIDSKFNFFLLFGFKSYVTFSKKLHSIPI